MKEVIGKSKILLIKKTIPNSFNEYFVNVGPKLAFEIPQSQRLFEIYLKESDSLFE